MDELKDGIGLRAYGQKDPVVQYRIEGFEMFDQMIADIKVDVVKLLMNSQKRGEIKREETVKITNAAQESLRDLDNTKRSEKPVNTTVVNTEPKIGRNDPCICGSR
jgi:preprotein translocase subunit SecA